MRAADVRQSDALLVRQSVDEGAELAPGFLDEADGNSIAFAIEL